MKNNKTLIISLIAILIVGGLAFYGGMAYQKGKKTTPTAGSFGGGRGASGGLANLTAAQRQQLQSATGSERTALLQQFGVSFTGGGRGGATTGQIISEDSKSITVKMSDGSTKTVYYSDTTTINKVQKGSSSDLATGSTVTVNGMPNSDGSVTAQTIEVNQ